MIAVFRPLRAFAAAIRRFLGRRQARRLRALLLPTAGQLVAGLLPASAALEPIVLALKIPGPLEPQENSSEFWSLPLGAAAIRAPGSLPYRLLRLPALPAARIEPGVLDLGAFGLREAPRARSLLALQPHLAATATLAQRGPLLLEETSPELGVARPDRFGLDEHGRFASERGVPPTAGDRPPPPRPGRHLRVRTPLSRAPLSRIDLRAYRLDRVSASFANEAIFDPPRKAAPAAWLQSWFHGRFVYLPWMARPRFYGLGLLRSELFALWWTQAVKKRPGARVPHEWEQPKEVAWAMDECKEQMLIRRDCVKDEQAPPEQEFSYEVLGPAIFARFSLEVEDFPPPIEYLEFFEMPPGGQEVEHPAAEAYLLWRTLLNGLEER